MMIRKTLLVLLPLTLAAVRPTEAKAHVDPIDPGARRPVDLVICLDTSGSMTALIDSARGKLWELVSELANAEPTPLLRVGLLTYGSPNMSTSAQGWVMRHTDLTSDLDTVYQKMMAMHTNGGEEFVGWVLNDAVKTLSWSTDPQAMRLIFVAGNESADQAAGRFNFRSVAEIARAKDIIINAIYCGNEQQGVQERWDQVALHGGGTYSAIDMKRGTVQIRSPYDDAMIKLNVELNATYLPFGQAGQAGARRQEDQDVDARKIGVQSISARAAAKATALYENAQWDLVDACEKKDFKLEAVAKIDLPKPMQSMSPVDRDKFVKGKRHARAGVQKRIREMEVKRQDFLRQAKLRNAGKQDGLDDAMRDTIRAQAQKKGFKFKK